ncbi:MAG TPA: hypothetical protein PLR99_12395 [Polyangiaceae bacterium]|jgi:hypothetical protein|nr:hypothetical protein [Polyangiaceae bacterium]
MSSPIPVPPLSPKQISAFFALVGRLELTDEDVAVSAGLSVHTVRLFRASQQAPRSARCQAAIATFVQRNATARERGDVRLAPRRAS